MSDTPCQPQVGPARACLAAVQHQELMQVCECVDAGECLDRCGGEQGTRRGTQEGFFKNKSLGWVTVITRGKKLRP